MMLYMCIIAIAVAIVAGIVSLAMGLGYLGVVYATALAAITVIFVDGVTAAACRLLPKKWLNPEKKIFHVSPKEKKFYEKLKIRKWKDRVPEIGHFTGFRKNKVVDPKNVEYLDRFLLETAYGELGHIVSCFSSFLIVLLFPIDPVWFAVSVPVAVVGALMNLPSLFILRYNSYKLRILRNSTLKKLRRAQEKE